MSISQNNENKLSKVLMIGPGRQVRGGISTVVNSYFELGLDKSVELKYLSTMEDGSKIKKLLVAIFAYLRFCILLSRYDLVHVHMAAQASFTRKAFFIKKAYKLGKKIVIHQHAADFDDYFIKQSDERAKKKIRQIFHMADRVIVLSEEWEEFFGKDVCKKEKIRVIYNGVISPDYVKVDYSDHNILFLGRLGERKGSYDLLDAVPLVLREVPDAVFFLGGDGEVEESKTIVENNDLAEHVKFLGWVRENDKEYYLKKCSVFVLPSYHEGMPMSVLEAMNYGLATISTNAGGIPQIIENGVNGIRVNAGDVAAISDNIIYLLKNEEFKKELGQHAVERIADKFDAVKNIDVFCNMYKEILKER